MKLSWKARQTRDNIIGRLIQGALIVACATILYMGAVVLYKGGFNDLLQIMAYRAAGATPVVIINK